MRHRFRHSRSSSLLWLFPVLAALHVAPCAAAAPRTRPGPEAQDRLGQFLRSELPQLRPGTEIYIVDAPVGSGLYAPAYGMALPALRRWYADTTLRLYRLADYRSSDHLQRFVLYRKPPRRPMLLDTETPPTDPEDQAAWLNGTFRVADAFLAAGNLRPVAALLHQVEGTAPRDPRYWITRARFGLAAHDSAYFHEWADSGFAAEPRNPTILCLHGMDLLFSGHSDAAAATGRRAAALDPKLPDAWELVGMAEEDRGRKAAAAAAFRRAARLSRDPAKRASMEAKIRVLGAQ